MGRITSLALTLFGLAMVAFGVQHLVYSDFVTRVVPKIPMAIPWRPVWADLTGLLLIAGGVEILWRRRTRIAGLLLGALMLLSFVLLYVPLLFSTQLLGGLWTNAGKALSMSGGAFLIAALASRGDQRLDRLIPISKVFLSAFLILAGVQHFLFSQFVATLVPRWIPGSMFWTYFTGIALIAGGVGIQIPKFTRLAGLLTGLMIFLWIVTLHIPRALAAPQNSNETTAVFEAMAICGTALLIGVMPRSLIRTYAVGFRGRAGAPF